MNQGNVFFYISENSFKKLSLKLLIMVICRVQKLPLKIANIIRNVLKVRIHLQMDWLQVEVLILLWQ